MFSLIKKPVFLFIFILCVGIFLRTYDLVGRAYMSHDSDLFSWIVKDIVVNGHYRLIGQLTSAPGIFIGPIFYYTLIPFFLLFNMDPIAASIPITIFAILTLLSYYFVFSKLFNTKLALIITFLYAVLIPNIDFDRWVVPSTPANLWVVWYFYTIIMIARGNFKVLPLLGILIGLIWHIHIALTPALLAIPVALFVSKKIPNRKNILVFILGLIITSLPLITFEIRHNFSQTTSLLENFSQKHGGATGIYKLKLVIQMISKNVTSLFLSPQSLPEKYRFIFIIFLLLTSLYISLKKKLIAKKEIITLLSWLSGVIIFFSLSSSLISEYYLYNIEIIFLLLVSLTLLYVLNLHKVGKFVIFGLFAVILIKNSIFYTTQYIYHKGYVEKKAIVEFIFNDSLKKGFPCIGVSYIASPGENVGFRYLFYLKGQHLVHPSLYVPVYNIVIPEELSNEEGKIKFEHIGLIPPKNIPSKEIIEKSCQTPNTNLTDPMFGYVE